MIGIYKITNKENGKVYIGKSYDITQRWKQHIDSLESNSHVNARLQKDWNSYKINCFDFSILQTCSKDECAELEQYYINKYFNLTDIYNSQIKELDNTKVAEKIKKTNIPQVINNNNNNKNINTVDVLSIFSLKREKVNEITKEFNYKNNILNINIKNTISGCPTIYELDILMGLFKILSETQDINNFVNEDIIIHFTFRKLAKEMGLKGFGSKTKQRLENSIKRLAETIITTNFNFKESDIFVLNKNQNCKIIKTYNIYDLNNIKEDEKMLSPKEINNQQILVIDKFMFNLLYRYFKKCNYNKYMKLTKGISKKLFLTLHLSKENNHLNTTIDKILKCININIDSMKDKYYYNKQLKESLIELTKIGFINSYKIKDNKITIIRN